MLSNEFSRVKVDSVVQAYGFAQLVDFMSCFYDVGRQSMPLELRGLLALEADDSCPIQVLKSLRYSLDSVQVIILSDFGFGVLFLASIQSGSDVCESLHSTR